MNIYMGFDSYQGAEEGACLIFADTEREAKNLAYPIINSWYDTEKEEVGAKIMIGHDYLKAMGISELPHVIESPDICPKCELWGSGEIINGSCEKCKEESEDIIF